MRKPLDLSGKNFDRLTAIRSVGQDRRRNMLWLCQCKCGRWCVVAATSLTTGKKRSCGCLIDEARRKSTRKHGMTHTPIWGVWQGMLGRCRRKSGRDFENYVKRGVSVCEEWMAFENFYRWAIDAGYKSGLTIERIDVNKGYYPENCKWATWTEQARNRRNNSLVTINGETRPLIVWSEINGIPYHTVTSRIARGWSREDAVTRPIQIHKKSQ